MIGLDGGGTCVEKEFSEDYYILRHLSLILKKDPDNLISIVLFYLGLLSIAISR